MILNFSTEILGKPSLFPEKIWSGFKETQICLELSQYIHSKFSQFDNVNFSDLIPKIHTIRLDIQDRWSAGIPIHFGIKARTPDYIQFAPIIPVVSTQRIVITKEKHTGFLTYRRQVVIDNKLLGQAIYAKGKLIKSNHSVDLLALNDGFDNTEDFFEYFDGPYKGKIIHWTNKRY